MIPGPFVAWSPSPNRSVRPQATGSGTPGANVVVGDHTPSTPGLVTGSAGTHETTNQDHSMSLQSANPQGGFNPENRFLDKLLGSDQCC